ncbi:conserved hypothetical protein [Ricinus communis]|uniref:Uncharacterized protein n=1 Tax=Ricinus communis TaxID=3988 RepID=B9TJZ3_RICCO|nr:conserved hypothetical protein [Ricinus communis]
MLSASSLSMRPKVHRDRADRILRRGCSAGDLRDTRWTGDVESDWIRPWSRPSFPNSRYPQWPFPQRLYCFPFRVDVGDSET